jgi:tetratricopeptide (TPR) repeat protein
VEPRELEKQAFGVEKIEGVRVAGVQIQMTAEMLVGVEKRIFSLCCGRPKHVCPGDLLGRSRGRRRGAICSTQSRRTGRRTDPGRYRFPPDSPLPVFFATGRGVSSPLTALTQVAFKVTFYPKLKLAETNMFANSTLRLRHIRGAIITAAFIVLSATNALAVDPQDLKDCQDSADIPRMITACSTLAQDTALTPGARSMALLKRGFGNFALDHIDAAQADFSEAIKLNPKNNYAYHELGLTLVKKGDLTHAVASLTEAINIDPTSAASRFSRGQVYMSEDKLDEAIQDFADAIALGADKNTAFTRDRAVDRPKANRVTTEYYVARADAYYLKGNFKEAALDYDQAAEFSDQDGYSLIWRSVARTQGGAADSDTVLSAALDKGQLKGWPKTVGELLVGRITPAGTVAAAKNADQICEAHYYGGIFQIKIKDLASARKEFASARDGCPRSFREYRAAVADLTRLQSQ